MREKRFFKNILPIFMVLINLALSVSVVFLMRYVQNLLNSDVKINLAEIVTQNKDAITSRLMMNVNSLDITANKLSDRLKAEKSSGKLKTQDLIEQYAKENNTDDLFTANRDGMALFDGGRKLDISGRHYFRLAVDGIPNISDKLISRINGDEVFVISVPLSYNGEIVGTIQKVITFEEMYRICSLSIFSSQGYMYVINREGYVILHSAHPKCEQKSDNYFRDLYGAGNPKASEQMKRDIRNNRNGFIETTIAGREIFSAYTPIEKIHDWYMLFAFTSRGFYIIDCQDSPNIIFDFAHHRFLHETGLERHFSTASQFSYDNACVCSNNKPLDWFSSLFFVCAFFHFVTNHSNNEIGIMFTF